LSCVLPGLRIGFIIDGDKLENKLENIVYNLKKKHLKEEEKGKNKLILILQDLQEELGYLPREGLSLISDALKIPESHVYGVATFYHQFRLRPQGKHVITICRGTACHVAGSQDIYKYLKRKLDIAPYENTSPDGNFTVKEVRCIGACSLAPVMRVDGKVYGKLDQQKVNKIIEDYGG